MSWSSFVNIKSRVQTLPFFACLSKGPEKVVFLLPTTFLVTCTKKKWRNARLYTNIAKKLQSRSQELAFPITTGYCEERFESMESLCNTIAGDAPLFTMFRKTGSLVKCPFRGPFSFTYTNGARGQECSYPTSYLDTCSDNRRMQLRYQACLDVEGSEIASE